MCLLLVMVIGLSGVEFSPAVIIRVITKSDDRAAEVRFLYYEYDYYQLIIKIIISEKKKNSEVMRKGENLH